MKSFTGRVTAPRRRQIERSLERAARHAPLEWRLVVPIDPTPAEERWFNTLGGKYQFECSWYGRTWLDNNLARHADIYRYYTQGAHGEAIELLRELSRESAAMARGVPDAVDRMKALSNRLNHLDPHYSFGISIDKEGTAAVTVWPKYVGAERDQPLKIDGLFQFPNNIEGRASAKAFQEALDYGAPAVVHAENIKHLAFSLPAGLGDTFNSGEIHLGPPVGLDLPEYRLQLRVIDENGRTKAQLPLHGKTTNIGKRGADATFTDVTGSVQGRIRADAKDLTLKTKFRFELPEDTLPGTILPALHFIEQCKPPNSMVLLIEDREAAPPIKIESPAYKDVGQLLTLVRALDEVQRATGVFFPLPVELTDDEVLDIQLAQKLLTGEVVSDTWSSMTLNSTAGALPSLKASVNRGPNQIMVEAELSLNIAGQTIPLGQTRRVLPNAIVAEWPEIDEAADPDTPVEIEFRPGIDNSATIVLLNDDKPRKR
ncbi:hypothetical protein AB0M91_04825 [Micromonospora rifamycinica]|uniref:hypothetical protein n=1 Tax=Micromonospora rifamycinica TaxID=291594 RepID=UPI00342EF7ED